MPTALDFLSGVLGNATYDRAKRIAKQISPKSLEDTYIDAFQKAVDEERPRLITLSPEAQISINKEELEKALHRDLRINVNSSRYSDLTDSTFTEALAQAMLNRSVLVISGHNLSDDDYAQLTRRLIDRTNSILRKSILDDPEALQSMVFDEVLKTQDHLQRLSEEHTAITKNLADSMNQLLEREYTFDQTAFLQKPAPDSPPLPPEALAPRNDLVRQLLGKFTSFSWVSIVDLAGTGKTQLALSVIQAYGAKHGWWISLRGMNAEQALRHIEQQLIRWLYDLRPDNGVWLAFTQGQIGIPQAIQAIAEIVGAQGIVVIDDIPDLITEGALCETLIRIVQTFNQYGAKVVSTGQRDLPATTRLRCESIRSLQKVPAFAEQDVLSILSQAGAPQKLVARNTASLILGTTAGNPVLVAASINWLKQNGWQLGNDQLEAILRGIPLEDIREEHRRVLRFLDDQPRELLYRLSLLWEVFDRDLAMEIAALAPAIRRPGESLDELSGPWLDRITNKQYQVTPLLRQAGEDNLSPSVKIAVHKAIAKYYLSQQPIDISRLSSVVIHLCAAEDYITSAQVLTNVLISAKDYQQVKSVDWAIHIWSPDIDWPSNLSLEWRIMLRAAQVRAAYIIKDKEASSLDADLEHLISQAGPAHSRAILFAYGNTGPFFDEVSPAIALRKSIHMVRLLRNESLDITQYLPKPLARSIWLPLARIRKLDEIQQFLGELCLMSEDERRELLSVEMAPEGVALLIDRSWWPEPSKPIPNQDWDAVLQLLNNVIDTGAKLALPILHVAGLRAKATVMADFRKQPNEAIDLLETVTEIHDPDCSFLIHYTSGCIAYVNELNEKALQHLELAQETGGSAFNSYRIDGKYRLSIIYSKLDRLEDAKHLLSKLPSRTTEQLGFTYYDRAEMLGELAWVHWAGGGRRKAYGALYASIQQLLKGWNPENSRFKEAINKTYHALGWFLRIATTGQPPSHMENGEVYLPITPGFFYMRRERLGAYTPTQGFSRGALRNILILLGCSLDLYSLAWEIYTSIQVLIDEKCEWIDKTPQMAYLQSILGKPDQAFDNALCVAQARIVGLTAQSSLTKEMWQETPRLERHLAEREVLLCHVLVPSFIRALSTSRTEEQALLQLHGWEEAIKKKLNDFAVPDFWINTMAIFGKLVHSWYGKLTRIEELGLPADEDLFKVLWYLLGVNQPYMLLGNKVRMHAYAVNYLINPQVDGGRILFEVAQFLHQFWTIQIRDRSFAFSNPRRHLSQLENLKSKRSGIEAVDVVIIMANAVDVKLPQSVKDSFQNYRAKQSM